MRNKIMHTKEMAITATELSTYIEEMIKLLDDPALVTNPATQQAARDIRQVYAPANWSKL